MATNFGTKIAINAYKCISTRDNENVITYNRGFSWSTNPKKTSLIARCDDAAAAACYLLSLLRVTYLLSPPRTARAQSAVLELPVC